MQVGPGLQFAEELSQVKGGLFAAYLKLAPILREAHATTNDEPVDDDIPGDESAVEMPVDEASTG